MILNNSVSCVSDLLYPNIFKTKNWPSVGIAQKSHTTVNTTQLNMTCNVAKIDFAILCCFPQTKLISELGIVELHFIWGEETGVSREVIFFSCQKSQLSAISFQDFMITALGAQWCVQQLTVLPQGLQTCLLVSDQCADAFSSPPKGIPVLHSYLLQTSLLATFEKATFFENVSPSPSCTLKECTCFLHRKLCQILIEVLTWSWSLIYTGINIRRKGIWSYLLMFLSPNKWFFPEQMVNVCLLNKLKVEWMLSSHRNVYTYMCTQLREMYWSLNVRHGTQSWKTHCLLYCDPLHLPRYLHHI